MKRHANIPVFIPHIGCPNMCVFCNQRTISGVESFRIEELKSTIDTALSTIGDGVETEIAFFGGSFTGIERGLMTKLLETAGEYVDRGLVGSIRCSTRPDYIDEEILEILKKYGVKTVELGLQSTSDKVLTATKRGHTFEDERRACRLIREAGLELVGQMMIGLPESSIEDEINTARFIIDSGASGARIYPTVVFNDTELCSMSMCGEYKPIPIDDAVERSASVFRLFIENGVDVIRIGLCASENLASEDKYYAGPNHPALGELVLGRYFLKVILDEVNKLSVRGDRIEVACAPKSLSRAIGQNKINKRQLCELLDLKDAIFTTDNSLGEYRVSVKTIGG